MFNLSPVAITPLLVPLSLLGWAAWSGASGLRTFLYLSGFICAMMLFGRPDNFYWAVMITPILFVGLLFAPAALRDLITSVRSEEHTSELQSLMRISYAVFCLKKKSIKHTNT